MPGSRDGVVDAVEMDCACIAPDADTKDILIEQIAAGSMGRALANGSWDLVPGLPRLRSLAGGDYLASNEFTSS